jgi:hypothetical protein
MAAQPRLSDSCRGGETAWRDLAGDFLRRSGSDAPEQEVERELDRKLATLPDGLGFDVPAAAG